LAILQDKVLKPVLAKAANPKLREKPPACGPIEEHYQAVPKEVANLFRALGLAA
jgi:hypothetical protein